MIRLILDVLRETNGNGGPARYGGSELARRVGCERSQNGIAEAIRAFRNHVYETLLAEANIRIDRLRDIIRNNRRHGYCLSPKLIVRGTDDPVPEDRDGANDPPSHLDDPANRGQNAVSGAASAPPLADAGPSDDPPTADGHGANTSCGTGARPERDPLNDGPQHDPYADCNTRQRWALDQMGDGQGLRKAQLMAQFDCSAATAERDLRDLRRRGLIEFTGPTKTGWWRLR